jgi:hypothetical protein
MGSNVRYSENSLEVCLWKMFAQELNKCTLKKERGESRKGARGGSYRQLQVSTV